MSELMENVREMSVIKAQIALLNDRKKQLEKYFLERGDVDVADTKFKSVTYADESSQAAVTYTAAQALAIDAPNYLRETLGEVFRDIFVEEHKVEVKPKNKAIERMLIAMYSHNYVRMMPEEVIAQLPCDDAARGVLAKKLKGANFETDKDSLIKYGGMSERDASDCAYLYAEAVVWQTFTRIKDMCGVSEEQLLKDINLGVSVNDSTKITVT